MIAAGIDLRFHNDSRHHL